MAILRKLPAAVAVAALTATLVGCGSSDVRDERDQALMERDEAREMLDQAQEQAQTERDEAQEELDQAQADLEAAQAERDAAEAEAERIAMEQKAEEDAAAAAEAARQATIMEAKDALMMAKEALMMVPADASNEDMLAAEMAVVAAAQGVVDALMANGGSHDEIVAAMEPVTEHQAMVDAIQMKIDDAMAESDRMMQRMRPLELDGTAARAAVSGVWSRLSTLNTTGDSAADDVDGDGTAPGAAAATAVQIAADRAAVWLLHDPQHQRANLAATAADATALPTLTAGQGSMFDLDDDGIRGVNVTGNTIANPRLFSVSVANQAISVTARNARAGAPASANAPGAFAASDRDAPMIDGWTGMVHERSYTTDGRLTLSTGDDVNITDTVTTYTNQQATQGRYWNELFVPGGTGGANGTLPSEVSTVVTSVSALGVATLTSGRQSKAMSDAFPSANRQTFTYDVTAATTSPTATQRPVPSATNPVVGTYYGVPGRFTCSDTAANSCTATRDAFGRLSLGAGTGQNWVFTPDGDPTAIVIPGTNTDAGYLAFGYWLETTMDNGNGVTSYEVGLYTLLNGNEPSTGLYVDTSGDGTIQTDGTDGTNKRGSATYTGPAAGLFTRRAYDPESAGVVEVAGRFTADASLTADFDTGDMDIDGMITNFMHAGEAIDPAWSVTMSEGDIAPATATFVSNPTNQGLGDGSTWTGTFHGHSAADDPNTPVNETRLLPTGVSGKFSNTFDNGAVLGAFGATR